MKIFVIISFSLIAFLPIFLGCNSLQQIPQSEFSIAPKELFPFDSATIQWKVSNAYNCTVLIYEGNKNIVNQTSKAAIIEGKNIVRPSITSKYEFHVLKDNKLIEKKTIDLYVKERSIDKKNEQNISTLDSLIRPTPFLRVGLNKNKASKLDEINLATSMKSGIQKINLGNNINSQCDDLCPVISPDGKFLFLGRYSERKSECDYNEKIWTSVKNTDGQWSAVEKMKFPLNNSSHCAVISVSPDNNYLLLMNQYNADGTPKGGGISYSTRGVNNMWNLPRNIQIHNFYNLNRYAEFALSADRTVLVMSIQRLDSYGEKDIYVSFRISDDYFSEPLNLGSTVNTGSDELSPFLASDGKSLYFSSTGHAGFGGADLFVTRRLDNTWQNWSQPINLGNEINTNQFDAYFTITSDGKDVYMVGSGIDNSADIFKIQLPEIEEISPLPVTLTRGKITNSSNGKTQYARIVYRTKSKPERWGYAVSNPDDGKFQLVLPAGEDYVIYADRNNLFPVQKEFSTKEQTIYQMVEKNLEQLEVSINSEKVDKDLLTFDNSETKLNTNAQKEIEKIAIFMKNNPQLKVEITGYTDDRGSDLLNSQISQSRALSVANLLINKGVSKKRVKVSWFGKNNPVESNLTEDGRKKNRRVEFLFY